MNQCKPQAVLVAVTLVSFGCMQSSNAAPQERTMTADASAIQKKTRCDRTGVLVGYDLESISVDSPGLGTREAARARIGDLLPQKLGRRLATSVVVINNAGRSFQSELHEHGVVTYCERFSDDAVAFVAQVTVWPFRRLKVRVTKTTSLPVRAGEPGITSVETTEGTFFATEGAARLRADSITEAWLAGPTDLWRWCPRETPPPKAEGTARWPSGVPVQRMVSKR